MALFIFQDFLGFLKKKNFEYETETEQEFAKALRRAEDDNIEKEISRSYQQLMVAIDGAKDKKINAKNENVTQNQISNMSNIYKSLLIAKNQCNDLVYFEIE